MNNVTKGSSLSYSQQREVLSAYVHRFTGNHKPAWAHKPMPDGKPYPLQFKDDNDWLENTLFATNKNGSLNKRVKYCESTATWPNNPELRAKFAAKAS
jgi:hypothetical protein